MSFEEQLIDNIKKHKCLYDKQDCDFKNIYKRDRRWKSISEQMGIDAKKLKTRWKTLRNQFRIELAKINNVPPDTKPIVQSRWKYFDLLQFLRPNIKSTVTTSNYEHFENHDLSFPDCNVSYDVGMPTSPVAEAQFNSNNLLGFLKNPSDEKPDSEIESFFKAMSTKVTKANLTVDKMDEFQETILSAINAKLRQFRNESDNN